MPTVVHSRLPRMASLNLDARCWHAAMGEWPKNEPDPEDELFWDGMCIVWGSKLKTGECVAWSIRPDVYGSLQLILRVHLWVLSLWAI